MNPLSTLFASIVAIILLTIVPAYRAYWIVDQQVFKYVNMQTQEFANDIRHKGYIDDDMYEDFVKTLSNTEKCLRHPHRAYGKVYHPLQATDPGYTPEHTFTVVENVPAQHHP